MDAPTAFSTAFALILNGDAALVDILRLSALVTLSAVAVAAVIGLPLGAALALARFPGRGAVIVALNALMGLPPVVAGLALYLLLSRSGPLGELGWLFTPKAMIAAQAILIIPIVASLTRQTLDDLWREYEEQFRSLGVSMGSAMAALLWDARFSLVTVILAGLGRASAEVGAVLIVGGNIAGHTRTMTTAIALETSKGDLPLALGLGLILIAVMVILNGATFAAALWARRVAG
ncbi:MAG: ABC transporter permease [Hyphomicrobiales bacterium]|nr:ABC transporter permease [Hyphomicrobiales bacterium]